MKIVSMPFAEYVSMESISLTVDSETCCEAPLVFVADLTRLSDRNTFDAVLGMNSDELRITKDAVKSP